MPLWKMGETLSVEQDSRYEEDDEELYLGQDEVLEDSDEDKVQIIHISSSLYLSRFQTEKSVRVTIQYMIRNKLLLVCIGGENCGELLVFCCCTAVDSVMMMLDAHCKL